MSCDDAKQLFTILAKQQFKCAGIDNYPKCAYAVKQFDEKSGCEIVENKAVCTECYKIYTERPKVRVRLDEFILDNSGKTYNTLDSMIEEFTEWEKKKYMSRPDIVREVAQQSAVRSAATS